MISVYIRKDGEEIIALATISGPKYSADKARLLKAIKREDITRVTYCTPPYYRVHNARGYSDKIVEIGDAICTFETCNEERWI